MKTARIFFLTACLTLAFTAAARDNNCVKAVAVNDFLSSIGVNSSIDSRGENLQSTLECMQYLGARWIRSGYGGDTEYNYRYLHDKAGIMFSLGLDSGTTDANLEKAIKGGHILHDMGALIAFEGSNEPNNWTITYKGEKGGGRGSWIPLAQMLADFYQMVKADPVLRDYPVWSMTCTGAQAENVGLQYLTIPEGAGCLMPDGTVYADVINVHNYFEHPHHKGVNNNQTWDASDPGPECLIDGIWGNFGETWMNGYKGYTEEQILALPRVTTETGNTIGGDYTEEIQALMYMSTYLSQYKRGYSHTSMYILRDRSDEAGNQSFGFYTKEYEPRMSAHYLHNLTTILKDDKSIEKPGCLDYSIVDCPETVHDLLLQRHDGTFLLVLWDERYEGGEDNVVLDFGKRHKNVKVYDPTKGTEAVEVLDTKGGVALVMSDHPLILEIKK